MTVSILNTLCHNFTKHVKEGMGEAKVSPLFMERLNKRELETARVMVDLFFKGRPETRIAKFCFEKKFTEIQLSNFLKKLPLPDPTRIRIHNAYRDFHRDGRAFDEGIHDGESLESFLDTV